MQRLLFEVEDRGIGAGQLERIIGLLLYTRDRGVELETSKENGDNMEEDIEESSGVEGSDGNEDDMGEDGSEEDQEMQDNEESEDDTELEDGVGSPGIKITGGVPLR